MENLSRSLCVEWAGDGVRVNAVAPGVVASPTARDNYEFDVFDSAIPHIPVKRLGVTREVWSDRMSSLNAKFLKYDLQQSISCRFHLPFAFFYHQAPAL